NQGALAAERRKLAQLHVELADAQTALRAETSPPAASETPGERALREDMQSLTRRLATNRDEIARLTGLLAATDTRNYELQQELAVRDREISSIQGQLAAATGDDAEVARMQGMLDASQQERRRLADELAQVELRAAESEAALAQTRQELALRQSALASAEQTVGQMRQELEARRRSDVAATDAQIARLSAAVVQREQQLAEARSQVESLERSLDGQVSKAERFAAEAEQRRSALDAALKAKGAEIDSLNTRLAAALRDNEQLGAVQRQLASADEDRRRLAAELAQQDLAASDLEKELVTAQQTIAQGSAQLSDMRDALQLMQDQLAARDRDLAASTQRSIALESEVAARTAALDRQNREVARLEDRLLEQRTALESQLAKAQGEQQQLQQAAQERQRRVEELERKLLTTQTILVASERKAARLDEVEKRLNEEQKVVTAQEQELAQLRSRLEKEKRQVAEPAIASVTVTEARGPVIEIIDPPLAATRGIPSVLLRSPVTAVELIGRVRPEEKLLSFKVNEKPTTVDEQGLFRESVALREPQTSVNLVAIDRLGQRTALDFVIVPQGKRGEAAVTGAMTPVSQATTPVDFGNYHALVIGNQEYAHLPNLSTPVNDAREMAELLRGRYGFKTQLLINATRYEILAALNELRAQLTDRDNLLIFYAGHGELDNVNLRGHWLPVDAEAESSANWISNIAITDVLNVMAAKHVLVIADSCYSGAMTRSGVARLETGLSSQTKVKWYRTMSKARARAVLTSGGLKPVLDAGGGGHSIFTRALLDTLRDNQRVLEGYALYREVQQRVKRAAAQLNVDQDPQYAPIKFAGHEAGEFFFLPSNTKVSQRDLRRSGTEVAVR
ncbi:MAG: caspase family protein, partial [Sedimenticolaceae bacterium]